MKEKFVKYLDSYIEECSTIKEIKEAYNQVSPRVRITLLIQLDEKTHSLEAIRKLINDELLSLEKEALGSPEEETISVEDPEEIVEKPAPEVEQEVEKEPEIEKPQEEPVIEEAKEEEAPVPKVVKKAVKRSIYRIKE